MKTAVHLVVVSIIAYSSLYTTQAVNTVECNCKCLQELTDGWTTCRNLSGRLEEISYIKNWNRRHTLVLNDLEEWMKSDSENIGKLNETMRVLMTRLDERVVNRVQVCCQNFVVLIEIHRLNL